MHKEFPNRFKSAMEFDVKHRLFYRNGRRYLLVRYYVYNCTFFSVSEPKRAKFESFQSYFFALTRPDMLFLILMVWKGRFCDTIVSGFQLLSKQQEGGVSERHKVQVTPFWCLSRITRRKMTSLAQAGKIYSHGHSVVKKIWSIDIGQCNLFRPATQSDTNINRGHDFLKRVPAISWLAALNPGRANRRGQIPPNKFCLRVTIPPLHFMIEIILSAWM